MRTLVVCLIAASLIAGPAAAGSEGNKDAATAPKAETENAVASKSKTSESTKDAPATPTVAPATDPAAAGKVEGATQEQPTVGKKVANLAGMSPQRPSDQRPSQFSPAGALNNDSPSWLSLDGEYEARLEDGFSGKLFRSNSANTYFLNRTRLRVTIKPSNWLKFHVEGQDARAFDKNPPRTSGFYDLFDLRQAYLELGDTEKGTFAVRAGRQTFYWGEGRLVADSRWSFPGRSFDAVRATLRYGGYRLDAFAASVVQITPATNSGFSEPRFGNNIHGLYGRIEKLVPKAVIEPYVFWRIGARVTGEDKKPGDLNFKTYGFRWVGKLPAGLDYGTEIAIERGKVANSDFDAWGGHWVVGRTWKAAWKPRFFAEYNYATGDKDSHDNKVQTFDVIYPSSHLKWGETDQVGWRNIHDVRGGLEIAPSKNWSASANYHSYWLASTHDGLYAANGAVVIPGVQAGAAGRWVGQEADVEGSHKFANGIEIGAGVGHILPGTFIKRASSGHGYTYPYVMMAYSF